MKGEGESTTNTDIILGEIKGTVKAIDDKLRAQNGAINGMKGSINGLSQRVDKLPCPIHEERINNIAEAAEKGTEQETQEKRDSKRRWRELLIALVAALIVGAFTLIGVWLSNNAPTP